MLTIAPGAARRYARALRRPSVSAAVHYFSQFSTSSSLSPPEPEQKSMLQSFFQSLQKIGVGKQFELEKEKSLWGNGSLSDSSNIAAIMAEKNKSNDDYSRDINPIHEWKIFNDSEYGGNSECEVRVNRKTSVVTFTGRVGGNDDENDVNESSSDHKLKRTRPTEKQQTSTSPAGYCALTGYCSTPVDLINFEGIELMIRTDKPSSFLFSLKPVSLIEDDLYQVILQTSNNSWKRFHLPFHLFTLTARGQLAMEQRKLDNLKLKSVGVLITQPSESFKVEIQSVRAVTNIDDDVIRRTVKDKVVLTEEEMDQLYPTDDMSNVFSRAAETEAKSEQSNKANSTKDLKDLTNNMT